MSPRHSAFRSLIVGLVAFVLFARVVGFGFIYDDNWTLVDNTWLTHPVTELVGLLGSGQALMQHVPDATRPVMVLAQAVERRLFGLSPWGYHLDSLLLYALVCALSARLTFVLTRQRSSALFAGCFFAVAPLHAEVVAAINFREDLFAALGILGALLLWCTPLREPTGTPRQTDSGGRALGAAALLALALFGKESSLAFVPLAGVIAWCTPRAWSSMRARRRTTYALATTLVVWLLWRVPLALHGDDIPLAPKRPFAQLLLRTARFEVAAVGHALFPWLYAPDHWRQPDATFSWMMPFLCLVAGVALLGRARDTRVPALGVGIALAAPLACVPLLRPVNEIADRYFFLGALGGGILWGWALDFAAVKFGLLRLRPVVALACLPLAVSCWRATSIWRDERSLWTAAADLTPGSPRAWAALSKVHRVAREREAADRAMARALAADPHYGPALVTEIYNDLVFGRLDVAREHLAALDQRRLGDGGGIAKARRCAALDAAQATACIGP
jgi:hypothetical protein